MNIYHGGILVYPFPEYFAWNLIISVDRHPGELKLTGHDNSPM
jgi:hypothetical protein